MIRTAAIASALALALASTLASGVGVAHAAGQKRFVAAGSPVGDFAIPMASFADRRFTGIIRQRYDFSCGSAALATLLRHHYDYKVAEDLVFRGMWARGDRDAIRAAGFSLLDMKRWLASRGLVANGFKVSLDQIAQSGIPGIALIAVKNYRHFVVIKGLSADEVLLGDPSTGLVVMPRKDFAAAWNGIYFVLSGDRQRASQTFNRERQWAAYSRAPVADPFAGPVSQQALVLTAPFYGDF